MLDSDRYPLKVHMNPQQCKNQRFEAVFRMPVRLVQIRIKVFFPYTDPRPDPDFLPIRIRIQVKKHFLKTIVQNFKEILKKIKK